MSRHKVFSLLVSHSICSSSPLCLSTKPGWFQFPWPLIAFVQNVRAKSITSQNLCIAHLFILLFPFLTLFFPTYLYLTWKLWLAFCHIKFMFETTAQQAFSGLIKRLSTSLLQFPLVLTSFKIVNSQLTAGQRDSLSLVSHLRCVRFLNASLGMLFTELVSTLAVTPVSLTWVLWRWACCVNQSDSEAGV